MPLHPSSAWITRPFLSDRARIVVAILQRYGAHNRPTTISDTDRAKWFHDGKSSDSINECIEAGVVILHDVGDGWCLMSVSQTGPERDTPFFIPPEPKKRKRGAS